MTGETDLDTLIRSMQPVLDPETYVFATTTDAELAASLPSRMAFHEAEGVTLILTRDAAEAAGLAHAFPCRMITLNIHSSLDAVGFLARITAALAAAEMGVNPVSAFFHDHLFVPEDRVGQAMAVLRALAGQGGEASPA
ncbi:ACT domain-containing protein [Rhodobacteraceae bacterium NNCM2]|nr:ACT domain-containing protein [Coraliihabitans acroporae]